MALPQLPSGNGGKRAYTHWCYVATQPNTNWHAWVAGPCHWFLAHVKGRTKPCLHEMTQGELTCPQCDAGMMCEPIGYQPLYREVDARPCMVILHEYTREAVDRLHLHARVTVGRGGESSDGVYVVPALKRDPVYQSSLVERMKPADLTHTLLKLWGIPHLATWYSETHGAPHVEVKPAPKLKPVKSNGKPFSPALQKAAEVAQQIGDDMLAGEGSDAVIQRLRAKAAAMRPSTNGDH